MALMDFWSFPVQFMLLTGIALALAVAARGLLKTRPNSRISRNPLSFWGLYWCFISAVAVVHLTAMSEHYEYTHFHRDSIYGRIREYRAIYGVWPRNIEDLGKGLQQMYSAEFRSYVQKAGRTLSSECEPNSSTCTFDYSRNQFWPWPRRERFTVELKPDLQALIRKHPQYYGERSSGE